MTIVVLVMLTVLLACSSLRGEAFHNHLVELTAAALRGHDFEIKTECPLPLPGGLTDYVDICATRSGVRIICEVETSARYVQTNVAKANQTGYPLWIVVPNRRVLATVRRKLIKAGHDVDGQRIRILLQAEVGKEVTDCFPELSSANAVGKNKKEKGEREI